MHGEDEEGENVDRIVVGKPEGNKEKLKEGRKAEDICDLSDLRENGLNDLD
jgi:hypothetical protein